MKHALRLIPALALMAAAAGAADAQSLRILGRSEPAPGGGFTIQWPSSGFETVLNGTRLTATIRDLGRNWVNVEIDGVVTPLELKPGAVTYTLFSGPFGHHTIRVTRRTGTSAGSLRILDVQAEGHLEPTPVPDRRILVIGDSITSGYGVEGADQTCRYSHATQNADAAYPAIVAKTLGADLHSISVDGRGLTRNYAGSDEPTMETVAWRMLPDSAARWPSSAYRPQAVVVNLGTNDFAKGDPGDGFDNAYIKLLRQLRTAYPEAKVYAVFGPMLNGAAYSAARNSVAGAIEDLRFKGDNRVHFIEFPSFAEGRRFGCDWHPGLDAQRAMADRLAAALQKDLGWTTEGSPVLVWSGANPPASNPAPPAMAAPATAIKTSFR